jgi:hypothetical protein
MTDDYAPLPRRSGRCCAGPAASGSCTISAAATARSSTGAGSYRASGYQDELGDQLEMDEPHLNVAVFRCRRQLAEAGIAGAAGIVERRRPTRELRLGVPRIEIVTV